ncbi:MAG TPA: hypothetical protein VLB44_03200 [Kofleriaceae bacterium]|nr:hypothetical protein [Kofleriaceae bacterium]
MMMRLVWIGVLLAAGQAHADDKRPLAVLGVAPKDAALKKSAEAIAAAIRAQAGGKASEYRVMGTAKQIDAAQRTADCSALQASCAAKVGATVGAEYTIAGELDRRGTHQVLELSLVDVKTRQRIRSVHQVSSGDPKKLARTAYTRLIGGDVGELAIAANAQQGEILIDGQIVGGLFQGRATIGNLVKGSHLLAIRAKGYRPFEVDVTIESSTKQMLLLEPFE